MDLNSKTVANQPSKSDLLLHSAEVLADAAQCQLRREPHKYDVAEVESATADFLKIAKECSKMDDNNQAMETFVGKAEDYIRRCKTPHSA